MAHSQTDSIISICRSKLIEIRTDLLNKRKTLHELFQNIDHRGDEVDLSTSMIEEHNFLVRQDRIRAQLYEVDSALSRIEQGFYGICEETNEPIEVERLMAIPWTRLSIEGAEIREATMKRFAK